MSETVSAAAIAGSLESGGWSFLAGPENEAPDVLHVGGAAYVDPAAPSLLVEFSTLTPDFQAVVPAALPAEAPASVSGGYAVAPPDAPPVIVAGALQAGN